MLGCDVLVVSSANMDLVFGCDRLPQPGETLLGRRFDAIPGGKGANQAVAIARLGGQVLFVGCVGADSYGEQLRAGLEQFGVDVRFLGSTSIAPTGVAGILVDGNGQNSIVVTPGANSFVSPEDVSAALATATPTIVLTQLEIPIPTVLACAGTSILVVNPAPYTELPASFLPLIDVLTPNESETEAMTGIAPVSDKRCREAAAVLHSRGVKSVALTLGARGCFVSDGVTGAMFPAPRLEVVDTTAAGDAFSGALAYFLSQGRDRMGGCAVGQSGGGAFDDEAGRPGVDALLSPR